MSHSASTRSSRLRARSAIAVAALLAASFAPRPADAAASSRNYLTVQGRVADHRGKPLPGTWIFCTGSRRSSALVDSTGFYTLEVPGATLEELERAPLKIRIQARLKGWRFAMTNGSPELGLEMRLTKLESGLARLRVRSNDAEAVQAVASSVVLEANPRALLETPFIGSQGAQYETPPVPLTSSDEITVVGDAPSIPEAPEAAPVAVEKADPKPVAAPPVVERAVEPEPQAEKPSILAEAPLKPAPVAANPLPSPSKKEPAPVVVSPPAAAAPVKATQVPPVSAPVNAQTPVTTPALVTTPAPAPSTPSTAGPPPTADAVRPFVTRLNVRDSLTTHPALREAKPGRPVVVNPALGDGRRNEGREAKDRKPAIVNPAAPSALPPAASAPAPVAVVSPPVETPRPASGSKANPVVTPAAPQSTPPPSASPVRAEPSPEPRNPAAPATPADPMLKPVLIRNAPPAGVGQRPLDPPQPVPSMARDSFPADRVGITRTLPPPRSGAPLPLQMCDCIIRGTVEVQSDRPLSSRTEVVISIEGTDVTTTVELFMGSPRAFEIHPAPCGVHRFVLHTRSKQRFVLVSAEPRVVCTEGGKQQVRLVLEPVARWGASR